MGAPTCYDAWCMKDYEFSSAYVDSILRGLRRAPAYDALFAKLSPEAQALARDPYSETWQPARLLEEIGEAAVATVGESTFEDLTYVALKERFGPIVLPMIKSTLTASNRSPGTVLKKLNDLIKVALRGLDVVFQPEGTTGGILQVSYPRPVAPHVLRSWVGVLRFVFEVTTPGEVKDLYRDDDGGFLQLRVEWQESPAPPTGAGPGGPAR